MPIKIFAAPGDHRDDFESLEQQLNAWIKEADARIVSLHAMVNEVSGKREHGGFMMTVLVHYDGGGV